MLKVHKFFIEYILIEEDGASNLKPYFSNLYNAEYYLDYLIFCGDNIFPKFYNSFNIYDIFDVFIYLRERRVNIIALYYATICSEVGSDMDDPYLFELVVNYNLGVTAFELWTKVFPNGNLNSFLYPVIVTDRKDMTLWRFLSLENGCYCLGV